MRKPVITAAIIAVLSTGLWVFNAQVAGLIGGSAGKVTQRPVPGPMKLVGATVETQSLPYGESWRTFANPVAVSNRELMFFERTGNDAKLWQHDWSTGETVSLKLGMIRLNEDDRYAAVRTTAGLWLIGPRTLLILNDGRQFVADISHKTQVAAALDDGSVAVFGQHRRDNNDRIVQLRFNPDEGRIEVLDRGVLALDDRARAGEKGDRQPNLGLSVATLADGRFLILGGDRAPSLANIISPSGSGTHWSITRVSPMPNERSGAAVATLPDGRVVVAGTSSNCDAPNGPAGLVDMYDPAKNEWTTLPRLPYAACTGIYKFPPSIAVTPDGSIVLGGYLGTNVMVLKRDAASPTGYAAIWSVHGDHLPQTMGGILQALSDTDVVLAGGVYKREFQSHAVAYRHIGLDKPYNNASLALHDASASAAQRNSTVFVAAAPRSAPSVYAELVDVTSGRVRRVPDMPVVGGASQILWIDDERVLVKGIAANAKWQGTGEKRNGTMAIFDIKSNTWSDTFTLEPLDGSDLLAVNGNAAWLMSAMGIVQRMNLETRTVEEVARLERKRPNGVARLLGPTQLVAAGGTAQRDLVSILDEDCETEGTASCPERYTGIGEFVPAPNYERMSFGNAAGQQSTDAPDAQEYVEDSMAAIGANGTVYMIVWDKEAQPRFVRSVPGSDQWQAMPMPAGENICDSGCALLTAPDPRDKTREFLFLRAGEIGSQQAEQLDNRPVVDVWLWDEPKHAWEPVLRTNALDARNFPKRLEGNLAVQNGSIMSMGWHLKTPILWAVE